MGKETDYTNVRNEYIQSKVSILTKGKTQSFRHCKKEKKNPTRFNGCDWTELQSFRRLWSVSLVLMLSISSISDVAVFCFSRCLWSLLHLWTTTKKSRGLQWVSFHFIQTNSTQERDKTQVRNLWTMKENQKTTVEKAQ